MARYFLPTYRRDLPITAQARTVEKRGILVGFSRLGWLYIHQG